MLKTIKHKRKKGKKKNHTKTEEKGREKRKNKIGEEKFVGGRNTKFCVKMICEEDHFISKSIFVI